jgi:hypothetical protein
MSASLPDFNLYASWGHLPLYACLLVGLPLLVMLLMNFWLAARSVSRVRVAEQRPLSERRDANGIPLFYDQDTHDNDEPKQTTRKMRDRMRRAAQISTSRPKRAA